MSMRQLPPLSRTLQKRGFEGFSDYQYNLKHPNPSQLDLSHVETRIQKLILKNEQEIMATLNQLDVNTLYQATELTMRRNVFS